MEDLAIRGRHGVDRHSAPILLHPFRDLLRERLQAGPASLAVLGDVDPEMGVMVAKTSLRCEPVGIGLRLAAAMTPR